MSEIKSVAIAGASGVLGRHVLKALVDAGFQVTVLTRSSKPGTFADNQKVVEVDFNSVKSLSLALKGIDAVVSTVGMEGLETQTHLIEAAAAEGVKRFIPSEYGSCTTSPKLENLPIYSTMAKIRKNLQEQTQSSEMTWTVLAVGAFLEFTLGGPILLDFADHKATLFDEGDNRMSSTSMPIIGKAIAATLKNFEATKDKILHVSEVILTQNKVLAIAKALRPDIAWEVSKVSTAAMLKEALAKIGTGDFSPPVMMNVIVATACGGDIYGTAFDETDNDLLGIKELSEEELRKIVANRLAEVKK